MTTDDPQDGWITLSEAAERSPYSREALRLRVRRGKLPSQKGRNDGQIRVNIRDLENLPPPDDREDSAELLAMTGADAQSLLTETARSTLAALVKTMDNLRDDLGQARSALQKSADDLLADRARAERLEAEASALREALDRERHQADALRLEVTEARERVARLVSEHDRVRQEREDARVRAAGAEGEAKAATARAEAAEASLALVHTPWLVRAFRALRG